SQDLELAAGRLNRYSQREVNEYNRKVAQHRAAVGDFNQYIAPHNAMVEAFNVDIVQYNNRCANKSYYLNDYNRVMSRLGN
ncbi:MAG: SID1 transmembrane family member, partial [Acetobacteraceae bacterium]|nr:SID1 transmembrane family member [Acetobacteraceae bacterium]